IGKYPVTNEQYAQFIKETSHPVGLGMGWFGRTPLKDRLNQPVVGDSWQNAQAYCQWLSNTTGSTYRMPSEAEWEKLARGRYSRRYPWGDTWDAARCQHNQSKTTPVDTFPAGASPYGCLDMLGNCAEWTSTLWGTDPIAPAHRYPYVKDVREDAQAPGHRLYRGGS